MRPFIKTWGATIEWARAANNASVGVCVYECACECESLWTGSNKGATASQENSIKVLLSQVCIITCINQSLIRTTVRAGVAHASVRVCLSVCVCGLVGRLCGVYALGHDAKAASLLDHLLFALSPCSWLSPYPHENPWR